ncbi:MAG: hypothetical protein CME94_14190 [Hyphomonadaceae bacterium]|jgi:hypothetical protein|uniref:hypothetical protein n=1 Tax=Henriciella sp. TaxID=1968823 RepID=UPI000C0F9D87|nr:hypothetical protein [Henriciella sp.]MBF35339.1 hypothetical protein [Hyphomonadaceae bacterium]PHR80394.1 MAG: hypothetical protein COA64_03700 [Henriciella sp.]|tara:strand:+ start:559 stop:753 length:195 start_codon:yes stop_codon:yes gene_type:complete
MRLDIAELQTIGWLRSQLEALRAWRDEIAGDAHADRREAASVERHYRWLRTEIENLEALPDRVA